MLAAGPVMVWRAFGAAGIMAKAAATVVCARGSNSKQSICSVLAVGRDESVLGAVSRQYAMRDMPRGGECSFWGLRCWEFRSVCWARSCIRHLLEKEARFFAGGLALGSCYHLMRHLWKTKEERVGNGRDEYLLLYLVTF